MTTENMKCPKCGEKGDFFIEARVVVKLTATGIQEKDYPYEYDDTDRCSCLNEKCEYTGLIGEFKGNALKPYSVLLLYPDYIASNYGQETYFAHVGSANVKEAIKAAQETVAEANDCDNPEDFFCLLVLNGHHDEPKKEQ